MWGRLDEGVYGVVTFWVVFIFILCLFVEFGKCFVVYLALMKH